LSQQFADVTLDEYRGSVRAWVEANLTPAVGFEAEDEEAEMARITEDRAIQAKLHEGGFTGFTFPPQYGGQGLTLEHERIFMEEAQPYRTPGGNLGVSINILGATLAAFGTHEQKLRHLPRILSGAEIWLQLLSEPSGGSDLGGLLTGALRDGDYFVVNGQKTWSTGAYASDFAMCPVRTRWDVPKHKGISVLIVDLKTPGIEIRRIKQLNGGAEFCEEFFTDVMVPAENLVGDENEGWRVARGLLEIEHAWVGRGGAEQQAPQGVERIVSLVIDRGLGTDEGVRRDVVAMHVATTAQQLVSARVSDAVANGKLVSGYGSLLKLGNDTLAQRESELALRLAGAGAVTWWPDHPGDSEWSDQFLSLRSSTIAGGTSEIQRNNVSERVLGLPREPAFDRDLPFNEVDHN
jgi:alkylation response protein AidB-like acyl-CoA dehydrogenase